VIFHSARKHCSSRIRPGSRDDSGDAHGAVIRISIDFLGDYYRDGMHLLVLEGMFIHVDNY
jgi:hypothetical protein